MYRAVRKRFRRKAAVTNIFNGLLKASEAYQIELNEKCINGNK